MEGRRMAYRVVISVPGIPGGWSLDAATPGDALSKARAGRRTFSRAFVLDHVGDEVSDVELERRAAAGEP
jgi:hypothetical protein